MKRILIFLLFLSLTETVIAQDGYNITVKFAHFIPQKVRLTYFYEDKQYLVMDSVYMNGSTVTFKGKYDLYPGIYSVLLDSSATSFEILIDQHNQAFDLKCDLKDIQATMKVMHSDMNAKFYDYQRKMTEFIRNKNELDSSRKKPGADTAKIDTQLSKIDIDIESTWKKTVEDNPGTFLADMLNCMNAINYPGDEMFKYVNFAQKGLLRTPFFYKVIRAHIARHIEEGHQEIKRHSDILINRTKVNGDVYHYTTGYLLNFYRTFFKLGMNEVFVYLADKYFLSDTVKGLSRENREMITAMRDLYKSSIPGSNAKNVRMAATISGDSINILDNHKGGPLLLLFWSNGCGHCDSAENALKFYYEKLIENKVSIISVNNDSHSIETLKRNTEKKEFPWLDVCDIKGNSRYREYYYVVSTPVLYVIDDKNRIVQKVVGEDQITQLAKRLSE